LFIPFRKIRHKIKKTFLLKNIQRDKIDSYLPKKILIQINKYNNEDLIKLNKAITGGGIKDILIMMKNLKIQNLL
ncbi:hypothetical protein F1P61_08580, partial [Campylobacter jejuni]|nr:hypothetical protein [Campylobacter jejuni]